MTILVTGGSGYIGSHICLELLRLGKKFVVIDNLSTSSGDNITSLAVHFKCSIPFYRIDLRDEAKLEEVFKEHEISVVIHLAGKKSVRESVENSLLYYDNNLVATIQLLKTMQKFHCYNLIFSSSATVYGMASKVPILENEPMAPINPYGQTKAMIEQMLMDLARQQQENIPWKIVSLRYFNPVGLDFTGLLREECNEHPENLFPYILKVLTGKLESLTVFGNDYNTPDGTPIRDYIHITDLSKAHIKAIDYLHQSMKDNVYEVFNIGTGKGFSVLNILNIFKQLGYEVKYVIGERRKGDAARVFADSKKAKTLLKWEVEKCLAEMCKDSLVSISRNVQRQFG